MKILEANPYSFSSMLPEYPGAKKIDCEPPCKILQNSIVIAESLAKFLQLEY